MGELRFDRDRLLSLMNREKIGDTELAKKAKVSRTMIYYLKTGDRKTASAEVVSKIAGALNTTVAYLLGETEGGNSLAQVLPGTVHQLTEIAVKLSGVRQEELLRIAATFEKMETEESRYPVTTAMMRELLMQVADLGPNANLEKLIQMLRSVMGNKPGNWMIDLGDAGEGGPEQPGQG